MNRGRGRSETLTFPHLVAVPENRLALAAVQRLRNWFHAHRLGSPPHNPLLLHGPPGTGKSHLVWALAHDLSRCVPSLSSVLLSAVDFRPSDTAPAEQARQADLLMVEDVQHLPVSAAETLVRLLDERQQHDQPTVVTGTADPWNLAHLPARLTSRLAGGLVMRLQTFSSASRLLILQDRIQRRQVPVTHDGLTWLAENLSGNGRPLVAAVDRLEALSRSQARPLDRVTLAAAFPLSGAANEHPTVDRIAQQVSRYFRVDTQRLSSAQRYRKVLLPRHICMYLARRLTSLSLREIGSFFGGRDHSTVLHACQKVERDLDRDIALRGAVEQLEKELSDASAKGFQRWKTC